MNFLAEIPTEILVNEILSKLSISDIKNFHETSKFFHKITDDMMSFRAENNLKKVLEKENTVIMMENKRKGIKISDIQGNEQLRNTVEIEKIDLWV
jgi:hypothetical protein